MLVHAPAKINLCLYLGETREDGLHDLCSLFVPLSLVDLIEVEGANRDEVICLGIEGDNLAQQALAALRSAGWAAPSMKVTITKRIPAGAGLGGGSADAAAVLRLAHGQVEGLGEIAAGLGADVPSQLSPAVSLVQGAGEHVQRLPKPDPFAVILLPGQAGLATGDVFEAADRIGGGRTSQELSAVAEKLRGRAGSGEAPLSYGDLLVNDLEAAAISLRPQIAADIEALTELGAGVSRMTGSGSTVFGIFADPADAKRAAMALDRDDAILCEGAPD